MDDDFFRREYELGPPKRDHLFLWTVFILLLTGAVLATWLGSFYIFGRPEIPRNYRLLMKLHKLDPPKRFDYEQAPPGEFITPQKFYDKYAAMPEAELQQVNTGLLRDFIHNYLNTKDPVPYLIGQFTTINVRELGASDLFTSGMVALAQCNDYPQVLLEYVYTADPSGVRYLKEALAPGMEITPDRTYELSAILHIQKLNDGRLLLTAMPITYGSYTLKNRAGNFDLDPPPTLHLEGSVPLTKLSTIPPAGRNYAARPAATPAEGEEASPTASPASPQLVRVMPPLPVSTPKRGPHGATPSPTPALARATPQQQQFATPPPVPIVQATPAPAPTAAGTGNMGVLAQNATPTPAPFFTPPPAISPDQAMATPTPLPSVVPDHPDVQLQPFIEAQPTPGVATTSGTWRTFKPGQMPRGRLLRISEAADLADRAFTGEQLYLGGEFVVTAAAENRAVLRAKEGVLSALNPLEHSTNPVRVLVEFPAGLQPPAEGSTISRDEMRPFEITDVKRERDGTIDVIAKEITTPQ